MGYAGRPTVEIELSDEERETLQRWARRHSSSQALALRSRIVLACAEGHRHRGRRRAGLQPGHGGQVAAPVRRGPARRAGRRAPARRGPHDRRRRGRSGRGRDAWRPHRRTRRTGRPGRWPTATGSPTRRSGRSGGRSGSSRGARTSSRCPRPRPGREDPRPRRAVHEPAGRRGGVRGRRETADPGAQPDRPTCRCCPPRHRPPMTTSATAPRPVRRARDRHRQGDHRHPPVPHRADFVAFLNKVNREVPAELDVHVIFDNLSTHKTPTVQQWLLRHRRFHFHFTPTYGSWMNLVERWFSALTTKKLQRSAHRSVKELAADIHAWVEHLEREPDTVRLAQDRRGDPRTPRRLLHRHQQI